MGKVEILTLIAGVVLSIALALVVVPMFSSGDNLVQKQKIQSELIGIKNAIEMVSKTEGLGFGPLSKEKYEALKPYLSGLNVDTTTAGSEKIDSKNIKGANYTISAGTTNVSITLKTNAIETSEAQEYKFLNTLVFKETTNLGNICNDSTFSTDLTAIQLVCKIKL